MMLETNRSTVPALLVFLLTTAFSALPAQALYKVVGPDGKVTYTDRPLAKPDEGKVQPVKPSGVVSTEVTLPLELRQASQRFPVTLYTGANCPPCDAGRQLLRQRGIPFTEKSVNTPEDTQALQRIVGGLDLPSLTIGTQVLRGLQNSEWNSYLDLAAYPKESRLPANYPVSPATPLTDKKEAVQAPPAAPAPRPVVEPPSPPPTAPAASGFRF